MNRPYWNYQVLLFLGEECLFSGKFTFLVDARPVASCLASHYNLLPCDEPDLDVDESAWKRGVIRLALIRLKDVRLP